MTSTEAVSTGQNGRRSWGRWVGAVAIILVAWFLLFARGVDRDLNHDEHQFLAPGAILAWQGAQPYRDYPLFHLPNAIFAYAATTGLTGDVILGAKLWSILSSCALVAMVVFVAMRRDAFAFRAGSVLLAAGAVSLMLFDPLFCVTAGKTWNHEAPTALALAALLLLGRAGGRDSLTASAAAGLCAGLAVGFRLTFAPMLLPMTVAAVLYSQPRRRQIAHAVWFGFLATIAMAPSLYYLATAREAFLFGNLEFPRLALLDPENTRIRKTMTWPRKLRYFVKEIAVPSWPIFATFLATAPIPAWRWLRRREHGSIQLGLLALVLPFLLLGCFAPSRYQYQHYFVLIPFLTLGVVLGLQSGVRYVTSAHWTTGAFLSLSLVCIMLGMSDYRSVVEVGNTTNWFSNRAKRLGAEIHRHVPKGKVLTLAPAFALAGQVAVYPEIATGPFAWRNARLVPVERRRRLHLIAPADLEEFLAADPPAGILTGFEDDGDLERPLVDYAERHGFERVALPKKRHLWLAPNTPP